MDSHDHRSRQSNVPPFAGVTATNNAGAALPQHNQPLQATGQYPAVSGPGDRYQARGQTGHMPTTASAGRSSSMPSYQYQTNTTGNYPDIATGQNIQTASLQYSSGNSTEYVTSQEASQRPQQQPSSHQNAHNSQTSHHQNPQNQSQQQYQNMYGGQPSPSSPYEAVQQYPPRQPAAIEVLSNQFAGVPQTYYVAGEGGPTSAPNSGMTAQGIQQPYNQISYNSTQSPVARDALNPSYGAGITDTSQVTPSTQQSYGQQVAYAATQTADLENAFQQYEETLRQTFAAIRDSNLHEAGVTMIGLSEWLLGNAESLGMVLLR